MTSAAPAWQEAQVAGSLLGGEPFIYATTRAIELGFAMFAGGPSTYTNGEGHRGEGCGGPSHEKGGSVFPKHQQHAGAPLSVNSSVRQGAQHPVLQPLKTGG